MATTTDFEEWLYAVELDNYEEVYSLYRSVKDCDEWSFFKTQPARGSYTRWIVTDLHAEYSLLLASEKAKEAFLNLLEKNYCNDLCMEGWYAYNRAMGRFD